LNLLISSIRDVDVCAALFPDPSKPLVASAPADVPGKTNAVCDALQRAFQALDPARYLLCILTTLVRRSPPQHEAALALVKKLRGMLADQRPSHHLLPVDEEDSLSPPATESSGKSAAEAALAYLVFLADVNQLFDIALGMYDFQLVLLVARKSQKDPKVLAALWCLSRHDC
jgi:elongator complex protein 1